MVKIGDRVQIYETCSNHYGRCGIVIGDDFCPTFPYKVEFEDGDDCIFKGKDLIVLSTEEETTMLFEVGDEVRVRQPTNLFHSELGKVVSIDHVKLTYKVVFHRGNSDVYTCFDLILVKRQGETSMKFKVGDRVRITWSCLTNKDKEGVISEDDGSAIPYKVTLDDGEVEWTHGNIITKLEEKVMNFKVGDKVKVKDSWFGFTGEVGLIVRIDGSAKYPYRVKFDVADEEDEEIFAEGSLELVKEEEKVMKFKVDDKVKVKDSWFGHDGQVGVIFRTGNYEPYNYGVKFDVEGDDGMRYENFKEDSLELAKQSFTKSDLKTGMGVVLRDGTKGHVLLDTVAGDVIRFINGGSNQWSSVDEYDENMIDCDISAMDIVEVYSSKYTYCYLTDRVFNQDCVFKREEPKPEPEPTKMTMKEINEHFGKAIEIIE